MIESLSDIVTDEFLRNLTPVVNSVHYHAAEPLWRSPKFNRVMPDFDIWYIADGKGQVMLNDERQRKRPLFTLVCRRLALELLEKIFELSDVRNRPAFGFPPRHPGTT